MPNEYMSCLPVRRFTASGFVGYLDFSIRNRLNLKKYLTQM